MISLLVTSVAFTACSKDDIEPSSASDSSNEGSWVDLGLPSGTLWATCNVGASAPEEYGDYFAWGETIGYYGGKTKFNWGTYKYCYMGQFTSLTKYCTANSFGYNDFTDDKIELDSGDDAATANWGGSWQIPSADQFKELINPEYTTISWITIGIISGCKITSKKNSKSIFLPAAGSIHEDYLSSAEKSGYYLSRSINANYPSNVYRFVFDANNIQTINTMTESLIIEYKRKGIPSEQIPSEAWQKLAKQIDNIAITSLDRFYGRCIRPVRK